MALLKREKTEERCASCRFFFYMGLAGEHTTGQGQCLRFPTPVTKRVDAWCGEWSLEKSPEPEIAEDGV